MPTSVAAKSKIKGGYQHRVLRVDLSREKFEDWTPDDDFVTEHIGGRGYGAALVAERLDPAREPLAPENPLIIAPGPLTGLYLPAAGKTSFASISPATGLYGDSSMGGSIGVELRQAGLDALEITGRAPEMSYLFIDDHETSVVPDPSIAGMTCLELEGYLKRRLGDEHIKIISIGPAGENLVVIACINGDWSRNAGRTGMGAVMGSKNLKAIVVRGAEDIPVADLGRLKELSDGAYARIAANPYFRFWQQQGLMSVVDYVNEAGVMPTHNFRDGYFPGSQRINGFQMVSRYKIGDTACFACSMACGNVCLVRDGKYVGTVCEGPEYETACMLGSNVGVDNFACILRGNQLCDELGVDTISTGNLIGLVIEARLEGLLTAADVDGLELSWGAEEAILKLIEKIAHREGVGDVLAGGSRKVLETWPQVKDILSHVKGLEQSAYDARAAVSMALAYGTSDIGAHHTRAWTLARELEEGDDWGVEEKVDLVIYHQTIRPLFDMLGVCRLPWIELGFGERAYADFFNAATGLDFSLDDLLERSRRTYDLTRSINTALGATRDDDYPPERMFTTPIATGPRASSTVNREEYERLLDRYYEKRGWDASGVPRISVLKAAKPKGEKKRKAQVKAAASS